MTNACASAPAYDEFTKGFTDFPSPSAPTMNKGFDADEGFVKPPTAPPYDASVQERRPIVNFGSLSDEDVREACLRYAAQHCCYGKKFARQMILTHILNTHAYHYKLESYAEKRQTVSETAPYFGQSIDGPENGPPPQPWDIEVKPPSLFVNHKTEKEVPHTAYVKECFKCVGNRRVRCTSCYGRGGRSCSSCNGSGKRSSDGERCSLCNGTGHRRCSWCKGTGQIECPKCWGKGKLKHYKKLIVTWKNHVDNFVSDTFNLARELMMDVAGRDILLEQHPKLFPVTHVPDHAVNQASCAFIRKHETSFPQELIRMQRQTLRAVPFAKVNYWWRNRTGECYVYGFEKKVYFEDYPQKCGCCVCF